MGNNKVKMVSGLERRIVRFRIVFKAFNKSREISGGLIKACRNLKRFLALRIRSHGKLILPRIVKVDTRYFFSPNIPGWPSAAFDSFLNRELLRIKNPENNRAPLQSIIFSVTGRCSYNCEHCYERENISADDYLSFHEIKRSLEKIHEYGINNVQLSGGEPLSRFDDLIKLLNFSAGDADYWILTSGYKLTGEKAMQLKNSGLTGAIISLDHWDKDIHNNFRKHKDAFFWAEEAVKNCNDNGIVSALSICATREFLSEENLWKFARLARDWGVGFIRILEPRSVGAYAGKKVLLNSEKKKIIEDFFLSINSHKKFNDFPLVMYPGFHQKNGGCFGAGNRYLYIDSRGEVHACPFCQGSVGNILINELPELVTLLKARGCHFYSTTND